MQFSNVLVQFGKGRPVVARRVEFDFRSESDRFEPDLTAPKLRRMLREPLDVLVRSTLYMLCEFPSERRKALPFLAPPGSVYSTYAVKIDCGYFVYQHSACRIVEEASDWWILLTLVPEWRPHSKGPLGTIEFMKRRPPSWW